MLICEIFTLKDRKLLILPTPPLFEAPALGEHVECRDEIWHQKTHRATRWWRNHDASFLRFDTIPARDRQTDRHVTIAITRASIASRG